MAHTLNLAMKDCIGSDENNQNNNLKNSTILDVISKSRAIVSHFKQSCKSANILREMQTQMNVKYLRLNKMFQRDGTLHFSCSKDYYEVPLSAALALLDNPPPGLNSDEWFVLEDCVSVLEPIEKMSTTLSGDSYPTSSSIIPLVRCL